MHLSIYIADQLGEHIQKDAKERGIKVSNLITEMAEKYYSGQSSVTPQEYTQEKESLNKQLEQKGLEIERLHNDYKHEKEVLTIKLEQLQKELTIQLEQKDKELAKLDKDYEWLKGMYSVAVTKALPEPKKHWWDGILRRNKTNVG